MDNKPTMTSVQITLDTRRSYFHQDVTFHFCSSPICDRRSFYRDHPQTLQRQCKLMTCRVCPHSPLIFTSIAMHQCTTNHGFREINKQCNTKEHLKSYYKLKLTNQYLKFTLITVALRGKNGYWQEIQRHVNKDYLT